MVKSRYLCSAPRPESWDEKAEALLKSLGGSALQQETMLRKTLDSLRVMHADKQKTGPGRKSNAEHAIAFYEYVLETITENKEGASSSASSSSDAAADEAPPPAAAVPPVVPVKRKRGRPRKNPLPVDASNPQQQQQPPPAKKNRVMVATNAAPLKTNGNHDKSDNNSTPGSSDDDHSYSVASMDTAEFINQHNDLCEVCNTGGELLMCSTCNLVFHLQCVRPKMDEAPPDSWVCAYCIMSGVKGLKQNSKMRKNAAVAVRLMARMRKQLQRQKNRGNQATNDDDGDSDDQEPQTASAEGVSDASESASSSDAEASGKEDEEKQQHEQQQSEEAGDVSSSGECATAPAEVSSPGAVEIEASASEESEQPAATTPVASATPEQLDEEQQPSPDDKNVAAIEGKGSGEGDNADNNSMRVKNEPLADENGDGTVVASEAKASSQKSEASGAGDDDVSPRKNNHEMDDATLDAIVAEEVKSSGRVRRQRKQANYYDPQSGPASHWKTDGANEWKYLSQHQLQNQTSEDDEVDDVDDGSSEDNATTGRGDRKGELAATGEDSPVTKKGSKKSGKTWCHFCNDNKDIPVCCFCACRVCFGKHDQTQLLLCDNCDSEYHLSCLNPPLKSVPSAQSWFCPSCVEAAKHAKAKIGKRNSRGSGEKASTPKSAGRKPVSPKVKKATSAKKSTGKAKSPAAAEPSSVKRGPGRPRKHPLPAPYSGPPRKRGRPPKNKSPSAAAAASFVVVAEPSISPPVKKRGRPRKNPLPETAVVPTKKRALSAPAPPTVKRGPGRPPKSASATKQRSRSPAPKKSEEKKKRAESKPRAKAKAVAAVKEEDLDAYVPTMSQSPVKLKSRTGRTVKRKSFHDEIDEGEQHLKSSRYAMQLQQDYQNGYYPVSAYPAPADPVVAAAQLAAYADAGAAVVADGGIQHVPAVFAAQEQQHHDVDPHFLENIPVGGGDLSHVAHLDTLAMDPALNLDAMHQEAMQMEAAMNLNSGVGEATHLEGDTKPAAVVANPLAGNAELTNEVRRAPVVKSLSTPPSTNLETNKNPASLKTVADTATPAVGNTVPAVGVLTQALPAETTPKLAQPALEETGIAQSAKESAPEKEKLSVSGKLLSSEEAPAVADNNVPQAPAEEKVPAAAVKEQEAAPAKGTVSASTTDTVPAPAKERVTVSGEDTAPIPVEEKVQASAKDKSLASAKSPVKAPAKEKIPAAPISVAKTAPSDVKAPALSDRSKEQSDVEDKKPAALPGKKPAPPAATAGAAAPPKPSAMASVAAASPQKPTAAAMPASSALPYPPTAAANPNTKPPPAHPQGSEQRGNVQSQSQHGKVPRRKPGARECMQISRRFGVNVIPAKYIEILEDYCKRGKVEHLIRMRERLDEHSKFLESQLAGLESLVQERGESDVIVPAMPESDQDFGE